MAAQETGPSSIFENSKFFLSITVPQRSRYAELIKSHGGEVVNTEKDSDIHLVDHLKRNLPPGSYTYKFLDRCVHAGKLLNLEEFRAGPAPGSIRPVGSTSIPAKKQRAPFTTRDDQILYDWMKPLEEKGEKIRGLKIYQQLEAAHPQHTYQSWRDRYLKVVKDRPRPVVKGDATAVAPSTEPSNHPISNTEVSVREEVREQDRPPSDFFTSDEDERLLRKASEIMDMDSTHENQYWNEYARDNNRHTATEWKTRFHTAIRPKHIARTKNSKLPSQLPSSALQTSESQGLPCEETSAPRHEKTDTPKSKTSKRKRSIDNNEVSPEEGISQTLAKKRRTTSANIPSSPLAGKSSSPSRRATSSSQHLSLPVTSLRAITETSPRPTPLESTNLRSASQTISQSVTETTNVIREEVVHEVSSDSDEVFETAPQLQPGNVTLDNFQQDDDLNTLLEDGVQPGEEQLTENEKAEIQELDDWVEARLKSGRAKDIEDIIQALSCTSLNTFLADQVLDSIFKNKGIPTNTPGIWTDDDDDFLQKEDRESIRVLQKKHGESQVRIRQDYLLKLHEATNEPNAA